MLALINCSYSRCERYIVDGKKYIFKNRNDGSFLNIKTYPNPDVLVTKDSGAYYAEEFKAEKCEAASVYGKKCFQLIVDPCNDNAGASVMTVTTPQCLEAKVGAYGKPDGVVVKDCEMTCQNNKKQLWCFEEYEWNKSYQRIRNADFYGKDYYMEAQKMTYYEDKPRVELEKFIKNCAKQAWCAIEKTCPLVGPA
ncbi:MAG: hypothetical protein H5U39_04140 [Deferribacterales bacterium]|nr:hypothetical protein [Deferribacterales bacterium]